MMGFRLSCTYRAGSADVPFGGSKGESMPLLRYFGTVGTILFGLLLLANFLLEPPHPKGVNPVSTAEREIPKPRIASRVGQYTVGYAQSTSMAESRARTASPVAPLAEAQPGDREPMAGTGVATGPEQDVRAENAKTRSFASAKPRGRSEQARFRNIRAASRHPAKASRYSSTPVYRRYAQERATFSSAEGTLGPH